MTALDNFFRNTWNSQRPHYYCRDLTTASLHSHNSGQPPPLLGPLEQHLLQQVTAVCLHCVLSLCDLMQCTVS